MTRIVVHIDRLVLSGIDRADAAAVGAAIEAELAARLKAGEGAAELLRHAGLATVRSGRARVPDGGDAAAVGRAVATAILSGGRPDATAATPSVSREGRAGGTVRR